jgi:hypothetical protein
MTSSHEDKEAEECDENPPSPRLLRTGDEEDDDEDEDENENDRGAASGSSPMYYKLAELRCFAHFFSCAIGEAEAAHQTPVNGGNGSGSRPVTPAEAGACTTAARACSGLTSVIRHSGFVIDSPFGFRHSVAALPRQVLCVLRVLSLARRAAPIDPARERG